MKSLDINKISEYINTYQRVILFDCNDSEIKKMYEKTRKYVDDNLIERVLVLSNFDFKEDKYIHFLGLYHTYEFSDRFIIILQNIGYKYTI
mgnify:CR=1 FL=1